MRTVSLLTVVLTGLALNGCGGDSSKPQPACGTGLGGAAGGITGCHFGTVYYAKTAGCSGYLCDVTQLDGYATVAQKGQVSFAAIISGRPTVGTFHASNFTPIVSLYAEDGRHFSLPSGLTDDAMVLTIASVTAVPRSDADTTGYVVKASVHLVATEGGAAGAATATVDLSFEQ